MFPIRKELGTQPQASALHSLHSEEALGKQGGGAGRTHPLQDTLALQAQLEGPTSCAEWDPTHPVLTSQTTVEMGAPALPYYRVKFIDPDPYV